MEFSRVRDKFAEKMTEILRNTNVTLELSYNSVTCDEASLSSVSTLSAEKL